MKNDEARKLFRQLLLLRIILLVSFVVASAATLMVISPTLFQSSSYEPQVAGPVTPSKFANTTLPADNVFQSSTKPTPPQEYGRLVLRPTSLLNYYGWTALFSWGVFGAALIWRGHVRTVWGRSRFCYETFRLLVKMRGAQTRLKVMRSLNEPKNKLQLATALGIDWKAADKHVQVLEKNGLIKATSTSGTATFYEVTDKGRSLMEVLKQLGADVPLTE